MAQRPRRGTQAAANKIGTGLMRLARACLIASAVLAGVQGSLRAADLHRPFLDGLRQRHYYDSALLYLEQLESIPDLPAEFRDVLPYERAVTHLANSRFLRNPEAQRDELQRADESLKRFVESSPNHPLVARASNERAQILLGMARVETALAESASDTGNRETRRNQARELIDEARAVFQRAHDLHEQAYQQFPTFIDPDDEKRYEARREVEGSYIRAQLDLALCTYERAHTFERGSPEFHDTLNKASTQFARIHERYRTQVVGLHARMWQGKCFEEQQEIGKALGVYGELIGHRGGSTALETLQDQVLQFRLICLNHEKKRDHALVVEEASRWLVEHADRQRTPIGLAIRWERARAFEFLANQVDGDQKEKQRFLRQALSDANELRPYPGMQQPAATAMISRLSAAFNRESGDPKSFDTALGAAQQYINEVVEFKERMTTTAEADERIQLEADLQFRLKEASRLLKLALQLADESTDSYELLRARYRLAFVNYELKNSYDAAILGLFVARRFHDQDERLALDAAYLALAAFQQAYQAASEDNRDFEMRGMIEAGRLLAVNWPESDKADDARMTVGQMFDRLGQPLEATKWYGQVPLTSPRYADAQLAAGRVLWDGYVQAARLPKADQPPGDELESWIRLSRQHFEAGIKRFHEELTADAAAEEALLIAKISLAQIEVKEGNYREATRLLIEPPQAPIDAVTPPEQTERPGEGVQSAAMARLAYRLLLRSYVGTQHIDEALGVMDALEQVSGGDDQRGLAAVYVELGREIEREIERLVGLDEQYRLAEVRQSFDQFLNELTRRKEQMSYGALIWIAETYFGLAEGMSDNRDLSVAYFDKAGAAYQYILNRSRSQPDFLDAERQDGVRLRLVHCRRRQGRYADSLQLVGEILQEKPKALDAQIEAAWVLQEWGAGGNGDAADRLLQAVDGMSLDGDDRALWGWNQIALRLQRVLEAGTDQGRYREDFLEARYNAAWCLQQYGVKHRDVDQRSRSLTAARQQIEAFAVIVTDVGRPWWDKFDQLYRQIQLDLGHTPVPLSAPDGTPQVASRQTPADVDPAQAQSTAETFVTRASGSAGSSEERSNALWIGLAAVAACGIALMTVVAMRSSNPRRRLVTGARRRYTSQPELIGSGSTRNADAGSARAAGAANRGSTANRATRPGSKKPPA